MKRAVTLLMAGILVLTFIGCGASKNAATDYPAAIMVDNAIYLLSAEPMPAEIDEDAITGYTESFTGTYPEKNGESNFAPIGTPYARVSEGIAVLYDNEWHLCAPHVSPQKDWDSLSEEEKMEQDPMYHSKNKTGDFLDIQVASAIHEQYKELSFEDASVIGGIIENGTWNEGTARCMDNCLIMFNGLEMRYHSECGTFNDRVNQRSLGLGEKEKDTVNSIFEKYIALKEYD